MMGFFSRKKNKQEGKAEKRPRGLFRRSRFAKEDDEEKGMIVIATADDVTTAQYDQKQSFGQFITASSTHIGTRSYQQDALYVSEASSFSQEIHGKVFGVLCDGMGGMEQGGEASVTTVKMLAEDLEGLSEGADIPEFFREKILRIDDQIASKFGDGAAGTTLVAVVAMGNILYWASVGDSRIYIFRSGDIAQVTRDHNLMLILEEEVEKGRITKEEAESHPQKDALISYIGSGDLDLIDTNDDPFIIHSGDIVLMCTDGLTKSLTDEQINQIVLDNYGNLRETARLLPLIAFDTGGSKDNTSVVLIQYFE